MAEIFNHVIQFTATQLLAAYVQSGELGRFALNEALAEADLAAGSYRVRHVRDLVRLGFLLSPETRSFVSAVAANMQLLRASSARRFATLEGYVRGAINWSRTVTLQVTRPTSFVCADPYRSFDLAENQMLRALIEHHHHDLGHVLNRWGGELDGWRLELHRTQALLEQIRTNPYYRRIPATSACDAFRLPPRLVQRVRSRRSRLSRLILRQFLAHADTCGDAARPAAVRQALLHGLRWPNENKTFELFSLFALVALLRTGAACDPVIEPIYRRSVGDGWFARARGDGVSISVYYQTVPPDLAVDFAGIGMEPSIRDYVEFLQGYGARLGGLRPDAVIDCRSRDGRRLVLVEVKNTTSPNTIRNGMRELVDYRHLLRSRATGAAPNGEVRGLLVALSVPRKSLDVRLNAEPLPHAYAITSARRLLATLQQTEPAPELRRLADFCWFRRPLGS
jgi:hypothetical protein